MRAKKDISKELLTDLWMGRNWTAARIADHLQCSVTTVRRYIKQYGFWKFTGEEYLFRYFWATAGSSARGAAAVEKNRNISGLPPLPPRQIKGRFVEAPNLGDVVVVSVGGGVVPEGADYRVTRINARSVYLKTLRPDQRISEGRVLCGCLLIRLKQDATCNVFQIKNKLSRF